MLSTYVSFWSRDKDEERSTPRLLATFSMENLRPKYQQRDSGADVENEEYDVEA